MGKYGNISVLLPETYGLEKEAVLKAVKEGTLDSAEGRAMILKIQREANLWIVMTNGGYTLPTRRKRSALRKLMKAQKYLDEAKTMLAEKETRPDGEEVPDPVSPEPIDTPSRGPITPVTPTPEPIEPPSSKEEALSELMRQLQPEIDEALYNKLGDLATPAKLNEMEQAVKDAFMRASSGE